ncbi:hypothetical protein ACFY12_06220 [Streptomyces sp. NPDC001339]|uniref:hypothetical protein n=1 Tax=Streptomyces sp. NPDC001339 TaxID=3364563 RepID=UPI00367D9EC0
MHGALGKLGFATDEIRRNHVLINGSWRDCNLNSVSAEAWSRRRERIIARREADGATGGWISEPSGAPRERQPRHDRSH